MDSISFSNCAESAKTDFTIPAHGWPDVLTCYLPWAETDTLADFQKVRVFFQRQSDGQNLTAIQ